uniref:Thiamin pyrophosphokinase thiamin-binding domain-containing protein n=1 Tax=Paramoeba aestuarina TaxID=180227 RepID=A0A7S4PL52_9EUKA|mmetsp:Transcript_8284/g.12504  ORF Transcript_8284/g.12504 Transcript_8284/m.12504 type:complete len:308 (+) Transcript_8284:2-925(+)
MFLECSPRIPQFLYSPCQASTDFEKALSFVQKQAHSSIQSAREESMRSLCDYLAGNIESSEYFPRYISMPQSSLLVLGAGGGRKDHELSIYKALIENSMFHHAIVCKMEDNFVIPIASGRTYCVSGIPRHTKCGIVPLSTPTISTTTEGFRWELNGCYLDFAAPQKKQCPHDRPETRPDNNGFIEIHHGLIRSVDRKIDFASFKQCVGDLHKQALDYRAHEISKTPTISTSNSILGHRRTTSNFKHLLLETIEVLREELIMVHRNPTSNGSWKDQPYRFSCELNHQNIQISSLHSPLLLLIEDISIV